MQVSVDNGILELKNNCFHQVAEDYSSLSRGSNDGGN